MLLVQHHQFKIKALLTTSVILVPALIHSSIVPGITVYVHPMEELYISFFQTPTLLFHFPLISVHSLIAKNQAMLPVEPSLQRILVLQVSGVPFSMTVNVELAVLCLKGVEFFYSPFTSIHISNLLRLFPALLEMMVVAVAYISATLL